MKALTLFAFAALSTVSNAAQITLGTNAIANPGAETGSGSATGTDILPVPGWSTSGGFTVVQYGATGGFPTLSDPNSPNPGQNFFAGGPNTAFSSATQTLDVSNIAAQIDADAVAYSMSGWFGGWITQGDSSMLVATFLNGSNQAITTQSLGGFTAADRNNITQFLLSSTNNGVIPIGTRSILFTLDMTRTDGTYNDAYADNLSFIATAGDLTTTNGQNNSVPEPATYLLSGLGIGVLWLMKRRAQI